jgi:hypothetical protein
VTEFGGKGGNRTLDPGIMSANGTYSANRYNNLPERCDGFRSPTYGDVGPSRSNFRHTGF